jgi:putative DNA primase/helicase
MARRAGLRSHGQKGTLKKALTRKNLSPAARRVIELRLDGAHAAAAKLLTMRNWLAADGRVHNTLRFHGASTGRWTSFGIQLQNLKRPVTEDLGAAIEAVATGDLKQLRRLSPQPMSVVGDITRALICAQPGHRLIAADLSGVESRVTAWVSGQQSKIDQWAKFDRTQNPEDEPYFITGHKNFRLPAEQARTPGKTGDLAFGYMGGAGAWKKLAPADDASTEAEIKQRQQAWRNAHPQTVRYWYALDRAARTAVQKPSQVIQCKRVAFKQDGTFLHMQLPSGRKIAYPFPRLNTNGFGDPVVVFMDNQKGIWSECRHGHGAYGGTWIENAVQAVARDLFAAAMPRLEAAGYKIVLHIHDEIVAEVPEGFGSAEEFLKILTTPPAWADGLPIAAKVREGERFCKITKPEAPQSEVPQPETPPWEGATNTTTNTIDENFNRWSNSGAEVEHGERAHHDDRDGYASGERQWGRNTDTYIYLDEHNAPYLKVVRTSAKQFPQFHRVNGHWVKGKPKGPKIPYRLPELVATAPDIPIFICEGEKDTNNVAALGLVATTNSEGAIKGMWTADLNKWFVGRHTAYILEDNDGDGRRHVIEVARELQNTVRELRIVSFPDLPVKGDVSDWIETGGTREQLLARASAAPQFIPGSGDDDLRIATASDLEMRGVDWLWPGRFALGKIGLVAGLPDYGKGQVAAFLAAAVTAAIELPCGEGHATQGNVIWFNAEDDACDTVLPRLVAAGANPACVHFVNGAFVDGKDKSFSLVTDLALLRKTIERIGNIALIIIDPISAYLGVGKVDSRSASDVRGVLTPLKAMTEELHVAVIGIAHFNKKEDVKSALLRVSDSIAYVAAARHVYAVFDDPDDRDSKLFVKAKNNAAADQDNRALRYSFGVKTVGHDPKLDKDIVAPFIVWHSEHVDVTANEAMAAAGGQSSSIKREAREFLLDRLADGPVPVSDLFEEAAQNGISKITLKRAKKDLGIVSRKTPGKMDGEWTWELPSRGEGDQP